MLARVATFAIDGLQPRLVSVEVDVRPGLPCFTIVGLADAAVREARERVRAALLNSGFDFPMRRITANLAPAHLRKVGPGFDLGLAIGLLAASGQLRGEAIAGHAVFGELSLGGQLRDCRGALAVAEGVRRAGLRTLILPREREREAALVEGIEVVGAGDLSTVVAVLADGVRPPAQSVEGVPPDAPAAALPVPDLADIRGHSSPLAALELAAAGGHNLLLEGAPGTGKTMLARRLPSILPPLSHEEALEVTRIHSVAGLRLDAPLVQRRPFRAPHHATSAAGLVGGGATPTVGEATLAHHGVLFLDELSEFPRSSLEALRQPLEDGFVSVVRGQRAVAFPTRFTLVAATNPCPCGFAGVAERCRCSEADLARHRRRLSGPLLDRIDLRVAVERPGAAAIDAPPLTSSGRVLERVLAARERQRRRLAGTSALCNGQMDAGLASRLVALEASAASMLREAYARGWLSPRGRHRVMRVARTVADLEGHDEVQRADMSTALGFRRDAEPQPVAA